MPNAVHPVLSVIVRKFRQEHECEVERSLVKIQQAVTTQPGFVGLQNSATHEQFGDLALLLHPKAHVRKIETVGILIFWILVSGMPLRHLTEILLPGLLAPFWEEMLLVSVSVVLISYVLLPWSCKMLTRLKTRIDKTRVR